MMLIVCVYFYTCTWYLNLFLSFIIRTIFVFQINEKCEGSLDKIPILNNIVFGFYEGNIIIICFDDRKLLLAFTIISITIYEHLKSFNWNKSRDTLWHPVILPNFESIQTALMATKWPNLGYKDFASCLRTRYIVW